MIVLHQDFPCIKVECESCEGTKVNEIWHDGQEYETIKCPDCDNGYTYQKLTQNAEEARELLGWQQPHTADYPRTTGGARAWGKANHEYKFKAIRLAEIEEQH